MGLFSPHLNVIKLNLIPEVLLERQATESVYNNGVYWYAFFVVAMLTNYFISVFMAYLITQYISYFYLFVSLPINQSPLIGA